MTIIEQKLIQRSHGIFDELDKWNAFLELQSLTDPIIEHWLKIATKGLRNYFAYSLSDAWCCEQWENERDTRWYLKEFGFNSLAIGFGWRYQFHLHLSDPQKRFDSNLIGAQLKNEKYARLLTPFGVNPKFDVGYGSKVMDSYFDFIFESANDGNIPSRELAWYAAHRTDDFIKQAAGKIERFTRDPEMTRLLAELNAKAQMEPTTS